MATFWEKMSGKAPWRDVDEPAKDASEKSDNTEKTSQPKAPLTQKELNKIKAAKQRKIYTKAIVMYALPMVIAFVVMLVFRGISKSANVPYTDQIARQEAEWVDLKNKIDVESNKYSKLLSDKESKDKSYYYNGDTSDDDKIAKAFFEKYCTWSEYSEYDALRDELKNDKTGIMPADDKSFVDTFYPSIFQDKSETTAERYNAIDLYGENSTFSGFESYPLAIDDSTNRLIYAAVITTSTSPNSKNGYSGTVYHKAYVTYSIINGSVANVRAVAFVD